MAIRVLSGILVTRGHSSGNATIHFIDHSVTGTLTSSGKARTIGPARRFSSIPCKMVSLRESTFGDWGGGMFTAADHALRIDDTSICRDYMEIEWSTGGDSQIEEIAYMVIGEVPDED